MADYTLYSSGFQSTQMVKNPLALSTGELTTGFIDFGQQGRKKKVYSVTIQMKSGEAGNIVPGTFYFAKDGSATYTAFTSVISSASPGVFVTSAALSTTAWLSYEFFPSSKIICDTLSLKIITGYGNVSISDIKINHTVIDKESYEK